MPNLKTQLAFVRELCKEIGLYLDSSKPLTYKVHKRIEDVNTRLNKILERADTSSNLDVDLSRLDELCKMALANGCKNAKDFCSYYIEHEIFPHFKTIYKDSVLESTETPVEERKEEPVMEKHSIADKLSRVETAISAGLFTDWDKLISDGIIYIDKNRMPRILDSSIISGSELLISVEEYIKARELENQMLGLYNVYLINVEHWKKKPAY